MQLWMLRYQRMWERAKASQYPLQPKGIWIRVKLQKYTRRLKTSRKRGSCETCLGKPSCLLAEGRSQTPQAASPFLLRTVSASVCGTIGGSLGCIWMTVTILSLFFVVYSSSFLLSSHHHSFIFFLRLIKINHHTIIIINNNYILIISSSHCYQSIIL